MRSVLRFVALPFLTLLLATQCAWPDSRQDARQNENTTHTIRMKFGPEWEFSNRVVRASFNGKKVFDVQSSFIKKLKSRCSRQRNCSVNSDRNSKDYGTVTYKDGWWFKVTVDFGTIEVISKPTTLSKFRSIKSRIDNDVFGTANSLHLETNTFTYGAGHIHIDRKTSGLADNPILFRNFIVDFFNHDEIASGILNDDDDNASPVSRLPDNAKAAIRKAVRKFDSSSKSKSDLTMLIQDINKAYIKKSKTDDEEESKYQALCLRHDATVEIRSLRMQRNMTDFLKELSLFENRIKYLKTFKRKLIPLNPLREKQDIQDRLLRFRQYVTESDLKWSDYKELLNEEHQQALKELETVDCVDDQLKGN